MQLDVVRRLLADAGTRGAGRRYLIQHSAGSGKSNSIAWLAHQLIGQAKDDARVFDSIIVVTDRRILDKQIRDTIKQYNQVGATVGHAERSGDLRRFIEAGKKIIISTVQKFPFILDEIGNEQFGDIPWQDADRVRQLITQTIPARVAENTAFQNARQNSDQENARIEHDRALRQVMVSVMNDDTKLFKKFMDDADFRRHLTDIVFELAYEQAGAG